MSQLHLANKYLEWNVLHALKKRKRRNNPQYTDYVQIEVLWRLKCSFELEGTFSTGGQISELFTPLTGTPIHNMSKTKISSKVHLPKESSKMSPYQYLC